MLLSKGINWHIIRDKRRIPPPFLGGDFALRPPWRRVPLVPAILSAWILLGVQPGNATVALGPTWSSPAHNISQSPVDSWYPIIVADGSDSLHCVWTDRKLGSGRGDVYYARRAFGEIWSASLNLSESPREASQPTIAVDGQQTVHVAWSDNAIGNKEIYYTSQPSGASWATIQNMSQTEDSSASPHLVVGPDEHLHLLWYEHIADRLRIYHSSHGPSGGWSTPQAVSSSDGIAVEFATAVDEGGTLHLAWSDPSSANWKILYAYRSPSQDWSDPVAISQGCRQCGQVSMDVGPDDRLHVAWSEGASLGLPSDSDILYRERSEDGEWSDIQNLSESDGQCLYPVVAMDNMGCVYVAWQEATPGSFWSIYCARRGPDGNWRDTDVLSAPDGNAQRPSIYAGHSVDVIWSGGVAGNWEICHTHRDEPGRWFPLAVVSNTAGNSFSPSLAPDTRGGLHVVWHDDTPGFYDIHYSSSSTLHVIFLPSLFANSGSE